MLKKDYLVRQLEEFGKVMAVILGYKKANDKEKFDQEIAESLKKFTNLEIDHLMAMTIPEFEKEVVQHPTLSTDQYKILAELLFEKLDSSKIWSPAIDPLLLKEKCLLLYQKIYTNLSENEFDLNVHYKLQLLTKAEK